MSQTIFLVVEYEDEDRDTQPRVVKAFTQSEKAVFFQEEVTKYTRIGFELADQTGALGLSRQERDKKFIELARQYIPEEYVGYIGVHVGCVFDVEETELD